MKTIVLLLALTGLALAAPPVPSSRLKAYRGPEGEVVVLVEANDGKQMLVWTRDGGKTHLYEYEDLGHGTKNVFYMVKRGSKQARIYVLSAREGQWELYDSHLSKEPIPLRYSDKDSESIRLEDVMKAYTP